ncbi:hypothetical protein B0H34DRAFT_837464 [Crassisporium funariophilum]|nr:hypothetical protein B0H34DRAFT_837464 [Crassisporium funariophilum]
MSQRKRVFADENAQVPHTPTPLQRRSSSFVNTFGTPLTNTPSRTPSQTSSFEFVDAFTPVPKRRKLRRNATEEIPNSQSAEVTQDAAAATAERTREEERQAAKEQEERQPEEEEKEEDRLNRALKLVEAVGYPTLHTFLKALLATNDQHRSSQVSRMLIQHGSSLLDSIRQRQPEVANDWAISTVRQLVAAEGVRLAQRFKPEQKQPVSEILKKFSMTEFLVQAELLAPSTCQVLRQIGFPESPAKEKNKKRELVLATTICMLAKSRNDHATEFQTSMGMYFLACGTSRSLFDVLNHAGITLSYTQAISKLKQLSEERLVETRRIAKTKAFMLIWDNLNIAFKVSEQRHDSKDHFDNGTTATLVPLYGVECGELPLKPKRTHRRLILEFGPEDLLPSREEAERVQAGQLWHIKDILYDAFPALRKHLKSFISPLPTVQQIPVHKTEQYPLPAMHIDESSLEGTLGVMNTIFQSTLQLSEDDIKKHGLIICAGDQLSLALLDKISAIRRDDSNFMDNVGLYTEGQDGLLHVKFAHTRMVANEFWGSPNSKSPWSLWKINTLLGRKAITAGWKAKSLPPFRPVYELMLNLTLPANILDEAWVDTIQTVEEVDKVAEKVLNELCSGRRVAKLRRERASKRDVPLENICLFNRDCLYLRQLKYAIKCGDVGAVLDITTHSMLAFRGTGKTPKYADALFSMVIRLKRMEPRVRNAWLTNWLANLSGLAEGFKEMDLLQEHQNFWDKIIYNAKGSNRTWAWLSMVSVCIFALRDVIRKMQKEFVTPYNGISHTSPSTETDIQIICDYLEALRLQTYHPERENNSYAMEGRDLMQAGSDYSNVPSAFRNFTHTKYSYKNHGVPEAATSSSETDNNEEVGNNAEDYCELDGDEAIDFEDLLLDEEEFPMGSDIGDYLAMVHEVIDELGRYQ